MFEMSYTLPPSVNECYAIVNGRKVLTQKARKWRKACVWETILIVKLQYGLKTKALFTNKVKVTVNFVFPDKRRRDQSNYLKQLYDMLPYGFVLNDDSQIVEEHLYSTVQKGKRSVHIKIEEISNRE